MTQNTRQQGTGLLEVVITLAVVATGLLGLAQLQLSTWQQNQRAYQATLATLLISDLSERLRANRQLVDIYTGQNTNPETAGLAFANADLADWQAKVSDTQHGLPQGRGSVTGDETQWRIHIEWDDQRRPSVPADGCATQSTRPACLEIEGHAW